MSADIVFQDPPDDGRGPGRSRRIAEALKARPGEWALVIKGVAASNAHNIKSGKRTSFAPAGSFEATSRTNPNGLYDIYARYVGENGEHA